MWMVSVPLTPPLWVSCPLRAAQGPAGGVREQAVPRAGEDREEPSARGSDPRAHRGLEGGHRRDHRLL